MMGVHELGQVLGASTAGPDARFNGVSTDTRTIARGDLFVALRGERFDGHDFLGRARAAGAVAALVDTRFGGQYPLPVVRVEDTKRALGDLARHWRSRFSPALIAVAGSNGKTTVKEMLASILRRHAGDSGSLATRGNLNNDIGLPLTLLKLRAGHRYCVAELGMNHKGEIAWLAGIARPTVALVNNAQREHLEFMRSVEDVAEENAAVYAALPAEGVAVVNADDPHAGKFRDRAESRTIVEFGLESNVSVGAEFVLNPLASEIVLRTPQGKAPASLAIPGVHNVRNALAAAACAHAAGIEIATIAEGLSAFRPYVGRLQVKQGAGDATVIDDSYNANPDSVRAAIDVLATCPGPTVLVLGDMGEVGARGADFHREVGSYASDKRISSLLAIGEATKHSVEAFGSGARHFERLEDLIPNIRGKSILVKGSRFMKMERVVAALTAPQAVKAGSTGGH
jgi:UDP-N-acetylmuramoyl-tripeptide--D-alanyl-D-alanine ligase